MRRSYLPPLLILSAIWGSSYMFIKIGLRDVPSAALVDGRLLFAAIVLVGVVIARGGPERLRPAAGAGAFVGTVGITCCPASRSSTESPCSGSR